MNWCGLNKTLKTAKRWNRIFRLVHTIKGTCGFLGLPRLEAVAHSAETVLGRFREGALEVTPAAVTLILESIDTIKELLLDLEQNETEPDGNDQGLIERLDACARGELQPEGAAAIVDEGLGNAPQAEDVPAAPEVSEVNDTEEKLGRALKPGEVSLEELERAFQEAEGPELAPSTFKAAVDSEPAPCC